jgi:hypothetical protein
MALPESLFEINGPGIEFGAAIDTSDRTGTAAERTVVNIVSARSFR